MKLLSKREVEILHLLRSSKGVQTGKSLSLLLEVTTRTIRNDIKKMNAILSKHGAEIVSHKGKGYELEISEEEAFQKLYANHITIIQNQATVNMHRSEGNDVEEQMIRNILMNCLTDTSIYQEELAEELFISLSALKSYLSSVKEKISRYGLELVTDRFNGIKVTGNEDKIRFCISQYLFNHQSIGVYNDLFPDNEIKRLKDIILQVLLKNQLKLTDVALENLIIHIEITIRRYLNNRLLDYQMKITENLKATKEYKVAHDIIQEIRVTLGINIEPEIFYITQHLLASSRFYSKDIDDQEYRRMEGMLAAVLEEIKKKTSIQFSGDQKLVEGLVIHLSTSLKRIEYQMNIRNEVLNSIKNNYPLAFQLAAIASNKISELTNLIIDENEIGFLAIHFGVALEKKGLNNQEVKKIMIVCGSGVATASLIREKLLNNYGNQVSVVETISLSEFEPYLLDCVDIVVSTVPIDIESDKIFTVSPILSYTDLSMIKRKVMEDKLESDVTEFSNIFKKDLFVKNLELQTKEDVLDYITDLMYTKEYIDESTKQSVYERERMASTELSNLLAIPHPLENNMSETSIAVCILNKPIVWDREKVQVIIVLSVPKEKQKTWEVIFKQLYHFLIEEFGITKLISNYNYEDFIRNLSKYKEKSL
ncbi:BglG family transcription antiterminator [Gracilibacillus caseinilyticus]|uniref:BglG family transcription antiterminator n=1 Tax=Gracilibacillus caseinilyticus TaxID=2932256 RepID=A0ABY4F0J9_9BACI|nr:BglG family transcription antiterminator [Gracilibacillus caseinilyticus]UOQ49715.1 BglG family transcription antiterminator [Gracilibacillus caseinilyticus]